MVIINVETMVSRLCSSIGLLEPFLLKLAQELNCGTSLLLDLNLKPKLWKTLLKWKVGSLSRQVDLFYKSWQVGLTSKLNIGFYN